MLISGEFQAKASVLFEPFKLRSLLLKNRIVLSPMATYGAEEGLTNDLHLVHYGQFALGGVGLIIVENTAVTRDGRITYGCPGLWSDEQLTNLRRIVDFVHANGAAIGIQLCHSGRKGASQRPWHGGKPLGDHDNAHGEPSWPIRAPSSEPFDVGWPAPRALTLEEIDQLVDAFRKATIRARTAGFDLVEMHCAHGYLLHSFLSPLANHREDEYGGSIENRMRFPLRVAEAMRSEWPDGKPVIARISSVDGIDIGWSLEELGALCKGSSRSWLRCDRLLFRRDDPAQGALAGVADTWVPSAVCAAHQARSGNPDCCRRPNSQWPASRSGAGGR